MKVSLMGKQSLKSQDTQKTIGEQAEYQLGEGVYKNQERSLSIKKKSTMKNNNNNYNQ